MRPYTTVVAFGVLILTIARPHSARSQAEAPLAEVVRDLMIPGDGEGYFFDRIGALSIGGDSMILALLPQSSIVLVFSPNGRFVRQWGRKGSGPGEFRFPAIMGWHSDTLWIFDPGLSRLTLFQRDGSLLRSIAVPAAGSGYLLEDGNTAIVPTSSYVSGSEYGPPMLVRTYSPSGRLIDTLLSLPPTYRVLQFATPVGMSVGRQPFEDGPLVKLATNGKRLLVVERRAEPGSRRFRVTAMNDKGDTLYSVSFPYRPVPLTDDYVDRAVEELLGQNAARPPDLRKRIESSIHRPAHLPTITGIAPGEDGTLWLRREEIPGRETRWTVLDERGSVLFDVNLPNRFFPFVASRSTVYGVLPDSLDVPTIQRYRVVRR